MGLKGIQSRERDLDVKGRPQALLEVGQTRPHCVSGLGAHRLQVAWLGRVPRMPCGCRLKGWEGPLGQGGPWIRVVGHGESCLRSSIS